MCCRKCLSKYHKECWNGTTLRRTEKLICRHCQMYPNDPDRSLISSDIMVCFETGQSAHLTLNILALLPNGTELVARQKRENEQFVNRKQSGNQQRSGLVMLFELQCQNQSWFRCCRVYCEMDTAAMSFIPFFPRMCRISLFPFILDLIVATQDIRCVVCVGFLSLRHLANDSLLRRSHSDCLHDLMD